MSFVVDAARHQWEEGHRRIQASSGDRARHERLLAQVAAIGEELRRRVGEVFTLRELVEAYGDAERWIWEAVEERGAAARPEDLALAQDAAFHLYSRGAGDFAP